MTKESLEKIQETTKEFFEKMTIEAEIEFLPPQESTATFKGKEERAYGIPIKIKTKEPQILIGEKGQTLLEIQRLLKIILIKKVTELFFLDVDINDYKKKKIEYLKEMARSTAEDVALSKKEKWLPSMPAYERRVIHLELAERKDVIVESTGEEPARRIIIKPSS